MSNNDKTLQIFVFIWSILMPGLSIEAACIISEDFSASLINTADSVSVNDSNDGIWWAGDSWNVTGETALSQTAGKSVTQSLTAFCSEFHDFGEVSIRFDYTFDSYNNQRMASYAVYGWNAGDAINLTAAWPGVGTALIGPVSIPETKSWTTITDIASAVDLSGFDFVGVFFQHTTSNSPFSVSSFALDNISLNAAPEPGTLVLITMGGLYLVLHKRRRRWSSDR